MQTTPLFSWTVNPNQSAVLNLCKDFKQISGLKINETKTKAACVGHLFDS